MSGQPALQRIESGAAWSDFCDTLKRAGDTILSDRSPDDPLDRAEGFRYLTRLTRAALEVFVEHADPRAPVLHRPVHETAKIGADNPDNYYQNASISGKYEYRIVGKRGSVHYLGFGTQAGNYGSTGRSGPTGYLESADMQIDPNGHFEILVSCRKQSGNWLPMEPDTETLIVRQTFLDREHEKLAELEIKRIDGDSTPSPLTPDAIDRGLTASSNLVVGCAALFANWAEGFRKHKNQLPEFDQGISLAAGGDPHICYYHSYWELEPEEALVVEVIPPECEYWNFQINNHWMESLDYRFHRIAINKHQARLRDDGSVRIVLAHTDPGVDIWLETAGHRRGTMCFRWVRAADHPQPQTRVVKLSEL